MIISSFVILKDFLQRYFFKFYLIKGNDYHVISYIIFILEICFLVYIVLFQSNKKNLFRHRGHRDMDISYKNIKLHELK